MLAVLSDIHGNLAALEAVVEDARRRGCDRFLSLGDVAGYHAQPGQCIDLLRAVGALNILGNHDSYVTSDEGCPRSRVVTQIINYQKSVLAENQLDWLRQSVDSLSENGCLFVHGGPEDPRDQYLYTVSRSTVPDGVRWLFSGHTHVQICVDFGDRGYCNPGSVGQPRDGDNRAAYAILDGHDITTLRVPYDIERTVHSMKEAGFEPFCYENLYLGAQIGGRIDRIRIVENEEKHP